MPKADNLPPSCAVVTKSGNLNHMFRMIIWFVDKVDKTNILGTLTSWNPLGLSRPVTGLLCLLITIGVCSLVGKVHDT